MKALPLLRTVIQTQMACYICVVSKERDQKFALLRVLAAQHHLFCPTERHRDRQWQVFRMPYLRLCRLLSKLSIIPITPHGRRRRRSGAIPPATVTLMLRQLHRCSGHACMHAGRHVTCRL